VSKKSFRVYMVVYEDGRRTGTLMRTWDEFFDRPPPAAYGATAEDVYAELEAKLRQMDVEQNDKVERYLWDETFEAHRVRVDVHPLSFIKKRPVIGKKDIPLLLTYASCKLKEGGYRIMVPRFGGWFIVEELGLAADVLRQAVGAWLSGESAKSIYDFRHVGDEYVVEWSPPFLLRKEDGTATGAASEEGGELARVAEELVERAAKGKLLPVLGDSPAFDALHRAPRKATPPSLLLVGPPGVGKTAFVRRMALQFAKDRRQSERGSAPRIYATSADKIIAGMVYLGMWQERCIKIVKELSSEGDYLYVDRLLPILRAQHDGATIAEFFEPAISAGEMSIIAECTESELEQVQRKRPQLVSEMQIVRLEEPSMTDVIGLLDTYAKRKENLRIHPAGLRRLARHLANLSPSMAFPGKAFRFVDWLSLEGGKAEPRTFYAREASEAYSRYSGVPVMLLADDIPASAETLAETLRARVIGQDEACDACGRLLARFKANMVDPERPCGTLLFVGPTGVGKTELAKQMARTTFGDERRMIRLDMSEYMLPGSSLRLLEARPGVKSLAARVREEPLSLVLFDEIEKAHPEVFDLLLAVLGEGRMTDTAGQLVDFRSTILVLTSNLGTTDTRKTGFEESPGGNFERSVRDFFRPELYNRLDYVLSFRALGVEDVERIVDLELAAAERRAGLARRGLRLEATLAARRRLAEDGHHPAHGARPLKRLIEERVVTPIAATLSANPAMREETIVIATKGESAGGAGFVVRI
jgi:ATP-dependent Clp protease ATP-binding subunit ClpC